MTGQPPPETRACREADAQLPALLDDLVHAEGRLKAARALGFNDRTLVKVVESGRLSRRMRDALERHPGRLPGGSAGGGGAGPTGGAAGGRHGPRTTVRAEAPVHERRRAYGDSSHFSVVTEHPNPNEEISYGRGMPAVLAWRRLNRQREVGTTLDQAKTHERIMALKTAVIGEYELTLPPDTCALHTSQREGYLRWRRRALADLQTERARRELLRWVRRVLTLGLWWR